ncbi:MAG TPA: phage baseplate protein [Thermoanaerobaculia bacterium]|nr:phage baseplate protein [Thermoanaerobaculia bacterium]
MRPLSARDLLLVWEQAERQRPQERALALLAAASPELADEELAALSLGRRDAFLLDLYRQTFGPALDLVADCPACREPLELALDLDEMDLATAEAPGEVEVREGGLRLVARPLTAADLAAAAACASVEEARRLLAELSVAVAEREGESVSPATLSDEEIALLANALAEADPQAEVLLALSCPECGHAWQAALDAAGCLWHEVDAAARRLLREVHGLARGYGWREADVLALSARRRRFYLEMLAE